MGAAVLLPSLLLSLSACNDVRLDPLEDTDSPTLAVVEDVFFQEPDPAVDVLFVVDDTPSMAQEQAALAAAANALVEALSDLRWQIGVTTTDMVSVSGRLVGEPWILTPDAQDPRAALARALVVGTASAAPEAPLAAAVAAVNLSESGLSNAGFRRRDAALHVVLVSDADDRSEAWLGDDPVTAFLDRIAEEDRPDRPARVSVIAGAPGAGCAGSTGTALPGVRLAAVASATGGASASICDGDYSSIFEQVGEAATTWPRRFALSRHPVSEELDVRVNAVRTAARFEVEGDVPYVAFAEPPPPSAEIRVQYVVAVDPVPSP